jgi:hypothetical protein
VAEDRKTQIAFAFFVHILVPSSVINLNLLELLMLQLASLGECFIECEIWAVMLYPVFMLKSITHRMHDPRSIVSHIRLKVFTDNQISRIKYIYYYINSISKDYDDSQRKTL